MSKKQASVQKQPAGGCKALGVLKYNRALGIPTVHVHTPQSLCMHAQVLLL